jgi:hypothetical protein
VTAKQGLPPLWDGLADSLPACLHDLHGPSDGVVALPAHLAWSGPTEFDLGDARLRLSMYRIVITTGGRGDFERFLNESLLVKDWPRQRKMLGRAYREAWETRFPQLSDV